MDRAGRVLLGRYSASEEWAQGKVFLFFSLFCFSSSLFKFLFLIYEFKPRFV
jgi:hypothetical protein